MWDICEQDRIKNVISVLEKTEENSGTDAILKKINELIDNFIDMKGSSNNWAGKLYYLEISWYILTVIL